MLKLSMKNNHQATHDHKRAGAVVLLESTAVLGKVLTPSGDEFWVKLEDLTDLASVGTEKTKAGKKRPGNSRPIASANSRYRVVRA
ncbi:MAG TPA: hypothetical protein VJW93_00475, partial [Candidatus Acidoferrales bacterium]|nr:hypothetical protein [Candidatus Acidoferrales bacterium]